MAALLRRPLAAWTVRRPVIGADLVDDELKIGPCTLRKCADDAWQAPYEAKVCIETTVSARDNGHAVALADLRFKSAETLLQWVTQRRRVINGAPMLVDDIGIFGRADVDFPPHQARTDFGHSMYSGQRIALTPVLLTTERLYDARVGHDCMWRAFASEAPTDYESRILSAIGWLVLAERDVETARSIVQIAFALEVLLKHTDSDPLLPSIGHQLAETVAFLIGGSGEEREALYKRVKDLYRQRSRVAHQGHRHVEVFQVEEFLGIAKRVVREVLVNPRFNCFDRTDALLAWLQRERFRAGAGVR
jgi:hypothetical protein